MVKMIAIDLDGTLLDDDKNYDKERFHTLAARLKEKGVRLVIATGNQHVKAKEFFEGLTEDLIFVTDNGSTIHIGEELFYSNTLDKKDFQTFLDQLPDSLMDRMVISTHGYGILSEGPHSEPFMRAANLHYPNQKQVSDLRSIDVPIIKITLKFEEDEEVDEKQIESTLPDNWSMTSSGFGFYDIISKDISKLTGIQKLQEKFNIDTEDIMAFGDSNNDLELLEALPNSYAMSNGTDKVKNASQYMIGSNNDQAVIDTIEDTFDL